jgi:DNA mismatch repair protein MutL
VTTRIHILPENLTNKIAAGEVVERPCSVVKELVENSLDAGCTDIVVEIEGGGKRLIQVTDDGSGMSREDSLLALERHATSKISSESDLFGIATLGFRGEALPAIASVSRFTLATRERGRYEGTEIYAEGGRIKEVKACGMAEGTTIAVRNLFFNTPARLKFMRSSETEAGHVGDFLTRLAVSRPDIRFTYISDGRTVFRVLQGDLQARVASLFGSAIADALFPVESTGDGIRVSGLIAAPECSRSAASHLFTFINGRFIRDRVVQHAILGAYRNFLERGRYPVVAIFIEVPSVEVDVNVHPTKHEVRFRDQGRVHDTIQGSLAGVLAATPWLRASSANRAAFAPPLASSSVAETRIAEVREALGRYQPEPFCQHKFTLLPAGAPSVPSAGPGARDAECTTANSSSRILQSESSGYYSALTVIGQFNAAYILCQEGSDLVIIDQHAAHERVAFEQLKKQYARGGVESQGLLFPETTELSFRETAALRENLASIASLGYEVEAFGGNTWLVKAVPRLLADRDYLRILLDILEELHSLGKSKTFAEAVEEILARIACHSVVRGTHILTHPEIFALFAQMDATDFSSNCPHGRPVYRKIALVEVERMFKRQ